VLYIHFHGINYVIDDFDGFYRKDVYDELLSWEEEDRNTSSSRGSIGSYSAFRRTWKRRAPHIKLLRDKGKRIE
jgi:hypothetical protein